jgi:release factor glutamine methyltransferase
VAYITGIKEFWSLPLAVTPEVLVPRPETELLVQWGLEVLRGEQQARIADLGTGSGCIALAFAKELPQAQVVAVEQSGLALAVALGNAKKLQIPNVQFRRASFEDFLSAPAKQPYDLIVSNPPYLTENDPHLEDLRHEPAAALEAGRDGLRELRTIAGGAAAQLERGGWLLMEHGAEQGAAVRKLLTSGGFRHIETRQDLAGLERATGGRKL